MWGCDFKIREARLHFSMPFEWEAADFSGTVLLMWEPMIGAKIKNPLFPSQVTMD